MKAISILSPGNIQIIDIPKPTPEYGEVVCRVLRTGICATDYAITYGEFSAVKNGKVKFPLQPGHEWSGVIVEVGKGVTQLKVGDRVVGDTAISCGQCYSCLIGEYQDCKKLRAVGTVNAWDGAMAEFVRYPARHLFKLPDNVSFDNGALVEPAATALYAIEHAPVKPGSSVAIFGAGTIGLAAIALCKAYGADAIIAIARSDKKLELCKELGATSLINTKKQNLIDSILSCTHGNGVDMTIELSGSVELFNSCSEVTKPGGTVSVIAFYDRRIDFAIDQMVFKNHTYKPVPGGFKMFMPVIDLLASNKIDLTNIITHRCTLEQTPTEIMNLKTDNNHKVKVMIDMANT